MEVALRNEIQTGKAEILCSLENGKIDKYEIEIKKIYKDNNYDNKSMRIKIIDERLIEKTGGIIQGMSGVTGLDSLIFFMRKRYIIFNIIKRKRLLIHNIRCYIILWIIIVS